MMKRLVAVALPLFACVEPEDTIELVDLELPAEVRLDGADADPSLYGVVEMGTGWDHVEIGVCWEPSAYGATFEEEVDMQTRRDWVQSVIIAEWGRVSQLRFGEIWEPCTSQSYVADIRIGHDPAIIGWSVQGTEAREITSGPTMMINLLGPDSPGCVPDGGPPPGTGGGGGVIHACNGTWLSGDPASVQNWVQALALHLFGYAIGLRKEDVHPLGTPCPGIEETLDSAISNGEAMWAFDNQSVMYSCRLRTLAMGTVAPTLSAGDVRSINSMYPGPVRVFDGNFAGESWVLGPGYYAGGLLTVSSIVVPPGVKVKACTTSACTTYTSSQRALSTTYNNKLANLTITLEAHVAADRGFVGAFQKLAAGTYKASQGQLGTVGNNAISSAHVPPGQAITLCDGETPSPLSCISAFGGALGVPALITLPGSPENTFAAWNLDNAASYVKVSPRVVTHPSIEFRGTAYSVGEGTYTISGGSTYLSSVRALTVPAGLQATVCNGENPFAFPRPTCQTLTQSGALITALRGNVKRLEVRAPIVAQP